MDVYLDTNAVSYFDAYPPDWTAPVLAKARERLIEEVDKGAISVLISVSLIEELLGISTTDPQKYQRVINFLWRVGQNNVLHSTEDLGRAEAKNGGPLEGNDRLEWWINVDIIRRASRNLGTLAGIPQLTQQGFAKFEQDEKARRDDATKKLEAASGEKSIKTTRRWWKDAEAQVDDWVTDFMRNCQQRLGLSANPAAWPKPQALQSIWHFHAYKMARIFLNVGEGRSSRLGHVRRASLRRRVVHRSPRHRRCWVPRDVRGDPESALQNRDV